MSAVHVTLKLATSLDGRIALADGTSQWITSADSRARVHKMRAEHDAVMVGIGTVLADDPMLTARTVPLPKKQPARIIADSRGRIRPDCRLMKSVNFSPVILAVAEGQYAALDKQGAAIWACGAGQGGGIDLRGLLARCEVEGINRIFVEGGGRLAASFLRAGLVNTLHWFRAPILIGGDGLPAIAPLGLTDMNAASRWQPVATERIGDDTLDTYVQN